MQKQKPLKLKPEPVTLLGWNCKRCGESWLPGKKNRKGGWEVPKVCSKCHSPNWMTEKGEKMKA